MKHMKYHQWALGMEHEFAIDVGRVDTYEKERYVIEKCGLPFTGSRVVLDLRKFIEFPQKRTISLQASRRVEPRSVPAAREMPFWLPEKGTIVDLDLRGTPESQQEILQELSYYNAAYIAGSHEYCVIPLEKNTTPLRTIRETFDRLVTSLGRISKIENNPRIDIESAARRPILSEVRSNVFANQTPNQILQQVATEETAVMRRVTEHLDLHENPEYLRIREIFDMPRVVYASSESDVLKIGTSLDNIKRVYLGSYHFWVTVPHESISEHSPQEVFDRVLPEFVENTRVFAHVVQWIEPILLWYVNQGNKSYRHENGIQDMGSADLTRLRLENQSTVVGTIPNLFREQLNGRIISTGETTEALVNLYDSDAKSVEKHADIRTERMLKIIKVRVKENTIDTEAWKRNEVLRGIEIRIFDNCPHDRIAPIMNVLFDIACILVRDSNLGYARKLRESSLSDPSRAIRCQVWGNLANKVVLGEHVDFKGLLSVLQGMLSDEVMAKVRQLLESVRDP
jgi:hypothetical protein